MFVDCRKTFSLLVKFLTDKQSFKTSGSWFQRVLDFCLIHLLPKFTNLYFYEYHDSVHFIQLKIITKNTWQPTFMIHKFMNQQ